MDQAEVINQKQNHSCYSSLLWGNMFTRADADYGLSSVSESEDDEMEKNWG